MLNVHCMESLINWASIESSGWTLKAYQKNVLVGNQFQANLCTENFQYKKKTKHRVLVSSKWLFWVGIGHEIWLWWGFFYPKMNALKTKIQWIWVYDFIMTHVFSTWSLSEKKVESDLLHILVEQTTRISARLVIAILDIQ